MSAEEDKIGVIRAYLLEALPSYRVQDGGRTHVDRTLLVLLGVDVISTVQIATALLDSSDPSTLGLELALKKENVAAKVLLSPVVCLTHSTLGIVDASQQAR